MKNIMICVVTIFCFVLILGARDRLVAATIQSPHVTDKVNWADFLAKSDLVWQQLPTKWNEGAFLGNGLLGAMIYEDTKAGGLRWEIGRSDVTDHRSGNRNEYAVTYDKARLPIGHFLLIPVGKITGGTARLDLWNAEAHGTLITDRGTIQWKSFVSTMSNAIVVECMASSGERDFQWKWVAEKSASTRIRTKKLPPGGYQPNPPAHEIQDGKVHVCVQPLLCGGQYATAWQTLKPAKRQQDIFISVGNSWRVINGAISNGAAKSTESGETEAAQAVQQAVSTGVNKLEAAHQAWWHAYYPESFLSIPDARLQSFYWIQMYKLASATRADRPAIDLLGPWFTQTIWPGFWCDLNLELTYYPVYTANRLELGKSLCRMLDSNITNLIHNAGKQTDCASIGGVTSYDCISPGGIGNLTWLCHDFWEQCSYGANDILLRKHLLPLLRRSVNCYLHALKKGKDGKLHLPREFSPEYGRAVDTNYNLSLLRWGCQTLINECARLKINDPLLPKWKYVLTNLTDYPVGPNGFMIGRDYPLAHSHRHYSHLLMIYPLYLVNWDQPKNRAIIEKSVNYWASTDMEKLWAGFSYAGGASMYASMGNGNRAVELLNHLLDYHLFENAYISSNTMYMEGGNPVMETPMATAQSIQDMVLQSWGGTIHVFPGVPTTWQDVVFHHLRAANAFLVSAARHDGKTQWVRIKSLAGRPCRVMPALDGTVKATVPLKRYADGSYGLQLAKGGQAVLYTGDKIPALVVAPAPVKPEDCNYFGSKAEEFDSARTRKRR